MSHTAQTTLFHKLRHTPMLDLFRLRLTSRLDWKAIIQRAELPQSSKELIHRVTQHTRLWRSEKADVATELIAHFVDGADAGLSPESLFQKFGDERAAAKLIRRAKKRNRPIAWHILRAIGWAFVALILFYLALAVYFVSGKPTISIDYVAKLNEATTALSADQRAWPEYREALIAIPWRTGESEIETGLSNGTGSKHWPAAMQWVEQNQSIVAKIRSAAAKQSLGFKLGERGDAYDSALYPQCKPVADDPAPMITMLLPHLSDLRKIARVLGADATIAREHSDNARFTADIRALFSLSRHTREDQTIISALVSIGIRSLALQQLGDCLETSPSLLNDDQLRDIAHTISGPHIPADLMSLAAERMAFYDIVQRSFSDDGHGNGKLTPAGVKLFMMIGPPDQIRSGNALAMAVAPGSMLLLASRREMVAEYDRLMDQADANLHRLAIQNDYRAFDSRLDEIAHSSMLSIRFLPIRIMVPALNHAGWTAERHIAKQEALTAAIALELYHRKNGKYPEALDELVPSILPKLPLDHMDGRPLRYILHEGKPVLYSVGQDRDDDHALIARTSKGRLDSNVSRFVGSDPPVNGDWILQPEPKDPLDADE